MTFWLTLEYLVKKKEITQTGDYGPRNQRTGEKNKMTDNIKPKKIAVKCNTCGGTGKVKWMGLPVKCRVCRGDGVHFVWVEGTREKWYL